MPVVGVEERKKKKNSWQLSHAARRRLSSLFLFPQIDFTSPALSPLLKNPLRRSRWPRPCSGPCPRCARSRRRAAVPSRSVTSARGAFAFRNSKGLAIFFWWQGGKQKRAKTQEGGRAGCSLLFCFLALDRLPRSALRRWCFEPSRDPLPPTESLATPSSCQPAGGIGERKGRSEGRVPAAALLNSLIQWRESKPNLENQGSSLSLPRPLPTFSSLPFLPLLPARGARGTPLASQCGSNWGKRPGERGGMRARHLPAASARGELLKSSPFSARSDRRPRKKRSRAN